MIAKKSFALFIGTFWLAACAVSPSASPGEVATAIAVEAASRTQTAAASPSATATSRETSTPRATTAASAALTATADFMLSGPHSDGVYRVGIDIAIGTWRSIPNQQRYCYWARRKYDGIVLGSHYGPPGGEMHVHEGDYEIEFDGCGVWVYMGQSN
jgi:hypothetical protein